MNLCLFLYLQWPSATFSFSTDNSSVLSTALVLSSLPSLSPSPFFCREKENAGAFLPLLQWTQSPVCSKLQRLPSAQRFSHDVVPTGWEEPELQDKPVCEQLCPFCSGVSGCLWASFSPHLVPQPFPQHVSCFPHIEQGPGPPVFPLWTMGPRWEVRCPHA